MPDARRKGRNPLEALLPRESGPAAHESGLGDSMKEADGKAKLISSSLQRGLMILDAFEYGHQTLGLAELVAMTGLEKTAVQRFTRTLVAAGLLVKDQASRRYSPGPGLLRMGSIYLRGNQLIERATPHILACNRQLGLTVNMGVLDRGALTVVVRAAGHEVVAPNVTLGSSFPWHISAIGQAIVAHLPADEAEGLIGGVRYVPYASGSIMSREELLSRLETIRRNGFAVTHHEIFEGDISVAAPIFDASRRAVAAVNINVVRPGSQLDPEEQRSLARNVSNVASSISMRGPWREK